MGLADAAANVTRVARPAGARAKRARPSEPTTLAPSTRTLRTRSSDGSVAKPPEEEDAAASASHDGARDGARDEADDGADENAYVDSSVFRYLCGAPSQAASSGRPPPSAAAPAADGSEHAALHGWAVASAFREAKPKRVYAMDLTSAGGRRLFGCAGADGWVSFYAADALHRRTAEPLTPLSSFKAHKGWIGDLQFTSDAERTLMLTSSNDNT